MSNGCLMAHSAQIYFWLENIESKTILTAKKFRKYISKNEIIKSRSLLLIE